MVGGFNGTLGQRVSVHGPHTFDSGAQANMTGDWGVLRGLVRKCHVSVHGIDPEGGTLVATGFANHAIAGGGGAGNLHLHRVFYVPGLQRTLISLSSLVDSGHVCTLDKVGGVNQLTVSTNGVDVLLVRVSSGLYQIPSPCPYPAGAGSAYWLGSVEVTHSLLGFVS